MLKIAESVKTEIESATGEKIPDPQSAGFEAFIEKLERDYPDLAQKLEDALEVTEPFPEEEARQNAKRRQSIAQAIQHFFFKEIWGRYVLNRRALTFILFFLIFGTVATSWTVMLLRKPSQNAEAQTPAPTSSSQVAPTATPQTTQSVSEPSSTDLLVVPEVEVNEPAETKSPPPNLITPVPEAPKNIPVYTGEIPQETLRAPPIPNAENVGEQATITLFEESPEGLEPSPVLAFANEVVAAPVLAFQDQPETRGDVLETEVLTEQTSDLAPVVPEAFLGSETNLETTALLLTDNAETDSPVLAFEPVAESEMTPDDSEPPQTTDDVPPNDLTIPETANEDDSAPLLETATLEPETLLTDLLQAGTLIPAMLTKDIVLTAGETRQVIADSDETWCGEDCPALRWLGEATLLESGRLEVVFKQVVMDDNVIDINGRAYGEDNAEGLPAHLADATPTLLADLLRSGAGGVSDYVEAQTNRRTVTEQGDTTVTEQNVPALLDFILGRAASAVQIPDDETNVIRLAAVPKGTRLEVLYLEQE